MSLDPSPIEPVPEETARVAHGIFPKGNRYLLLRDTLGTLFPDTLFADLFPTRGKPALAPWRLALVTLVQYIEGLPDRQAAEAVRTRIDLKYALSLSLNDPGFDFSVLSEFRTRLVEHSAAERLLDVLLEACQQNGWLAGGGRQRTDSTHVLARVRRLNRIEPFGGNAASRTQCASRWRLPTGSSSTVCLTGGSAMPCRLMSPGWRRA